ncbi:RimJ/RimL family protein N-acetyltransferase [Cytobacillus firmus]|uniref:RimJ/RimL family protein N-acetyltransferase n=2 Tax=Cytobacillus TaxID=2675230 RepID=A0A366JIC1_CYTFI|nr:MULTISPECIES: GNAT family N-acetyltransferase [Cytobacillus]RBP86864.1 RimJ/RimL family protein N-acetyltransferase [Cytobacillus firmus]TDX36517.1 RimJ/RimL family protein N-acetyltransferase [Cytobacillus oceanisediminis]
MERTNYLELKHFSGEHMDILNSFELPEEQVQFTSLPSNYKEVTEGQHRIVILCDGEPVGFFLLHSTERVKEYSDNPQAMLLTSLSINQAKQGRGYAKQAMLLLKKFTADEFPDCNEIVLAVNYKNIAAQKLYVKVGYQDTGRRKMGPIGEQFIMNLML